MKILSIAVEDSLTIRVGKLTVLFKLYEVSVLSSCCFFVQFSVQFMFVSPHRRNLVLLLWFIFKFLSNLFKKYLKLLEGDL
jgi:hypothetical protein